MALLASEAPGERAVLVVLDGVSNSIDSDVASLAGAKAAREALRTPFPQGMGTPASRTGAIAQVFADAAAAANAAVVSVTDPASTNPASATFAVAVVEQRPARLRQHRRLARLLAARRPGPPSSSRSTTRPRSSRWRPAYRARSPRPPRRRTRSPSGWAATRPTSRPAPGQLEITGPGWVLACSDGLWNYASEPEALAAQVAAAGTAEPLALALALVAFANAQGGRDNITAALARVEPAADGAECQRTRARPPGGVRWLSSPPASTRTSSCPDGGTDVNAIVTVTCSGAGTAGQTGGGAAGEIIIVDTSGSMGVETMAAAKSRGPGRARRRSSTAPGSRSSPAPTTPSSPTRRCRRARAWSGWTPRAREAASVAIGRFRGGGGTAISTWLDLAGTHLRARCPR